MVGLQDEQRWPSVDEILEAFELAQARDGSAEIAAFEPPSGHPERLPILCELVRVDLEWRWEQGEPRRLEHYLALFPELSADPTLLHGMAFEEYRLRLQAGESPTPSEYFRRFGLDGRSWPSTDGSGPPSPAMARDAAERERASSVYRRQGAGLPEDLNLRLDGQGVTPEQAEFFRELDRTDPLAAESLVDAVAGFPRVGSRFLGFQIRGELGRGAFGRVYLARQGDLADRLVALKVSANIASESHALAQLQHTNVVPIYSVHHRGPLQAVCMPYLGATTLADTLASLKNQATLPRSGQGLLSTQIRTIEGGVEPTRPGEGDGSDGRISDGHHRSDALETPPHSPTPQVERLKGLSYVPAVLWLVERVADGLAHAHERGVLHRDLKPANILFADDGEPLLLDFNLAADTKLRVHASAALVGGTLPYMAPEQLEAFRRSEPSIDPRSDVYALGVILHELLAGFHPFPLHRGAVDDLLPVMIADRLALTLDIRKANPSVSPAVASIVRHALEPDPDRRYQTAREFQDDLRRQLDNLPLRHAPEPSLRERLTKWARRHPRLTSSTTIGLVALALLVAAGSGFVARHRHFQSIEAAESFQRLSEERREVVALLADPDADPEQIRDGIEVCRLVADRYRVLDDPSWLARPLVAALPTADRDRLRESLGEILVRWSRVLTRRAGSPGDPRSSEALNQATRQLDRAEECYGRESRPRLLALARVDLARQAGQGEAEVRKLLTEAEAIPLRTPREKLQAVVDRVENTDRRKLLAFLDRASEHDPQDYANWLTLALCYARIGRVESAAQSYGVALALAPKLYWPHFNRGLLYLEHQDFSAALSDFDQVVALRPDLGFGFLNRALAKLGMDDAQGAIDDSTRCLEREGAPTLAWFIRSRAKAKLGDREGALRDRQEGLRRPPSDEASFVARGLARLPGDPLGAIADFDAALLLNPRYRPALQDKASVLSENLGRVEEAIKVLDLALQHFPAEVPSLAGRGVLLARLGRRDAALRDARVALTLDDGAMNLYQVACIFALTSKQEPADLAEALRLLTESIRKDASWLAVIPADRDLDPIRGRPEFRELLQGFAILDRARAKPK